VRALIREGMPHVRPRRRLTRIDVPKAEAWLAERTKKLEQRAEAQAIVGDQTRGPMH
jgi:hypothetical protein